MVTRRKAGVRLIWISATIGGLAGLLFLLSAGLMNHANVWLLVFFFTPLVILISLIGLLVGIGLARK